MAQSADKCVTPAIAAAREQADLWPVVQMLLGMGFECLLKCLLAQKKLQAPMRGKPGHNLPMLAQIAGLNLSPAAMELLEELTVMTQLGHYPAHSEKDMPTTYEMGIHLAVVSQISEVISAAIAVGHGQP